MHKWLLLVGLCITSLLQAQFRVTLRITALPSYHKLNEPVYIAGSFNNWNPGHPAARLQSDGSGKYSITLEAPQGRHEYKLTRGSWELVEAGADGASLTNRIADISSNPVNPTNPYQ